MKLVDRLERFKRTWLSNPVAQLDFARLVRDVHEQPSPDHEDEPLVTWIDEALATARRLGIR